MNIASNIEHWALIDGYDNYEISSFGRVRNNKTNRILKFQYRCNDYRLVRLNKKTLSVHRLVADAFCEKKDNYNLVDHIDKNPSNNHFSNLRWVDYSINGRNRTIQKSNISGYQGVYFCKTKNRWVADWRDDIKRNHKYFKEKDDAINHRKEMEKLHGYI